ncbi:hypothetical protein SAMN05216276_103218 [Streptosporangium subroseum]|uniref:Uncharacterized protein n=2 Tax=Streptosporangium subroseum TaxID=106412 RepID=A0A239LCH3_9ACTN|nr:hypothetical protein SAMN05216276_103218 [Streptosporangium subroseum]
MALPSPVEAPAADTVPDLTIRSVTLNPASPVVGPVGAVRLVVEVVARGVAGPEGVTIQVEPGVPPESSRIGTFPVSASGSVSTSVPGAVPGPRPTRVPGRPSGTRKGTVARLAGGGAAIETATVFSRAGQDWETWRFAPDKSLSRWYPAGRWTVTATAKGAGGTTVTGYAPFWLKRETRFGAVQAVRKGTEVQVDGVLKRVDPRGVVDYAPFAGQPVEILHRETAQAAWTTAATATSDAQGKFSRSVPDRQGGEWRIRFAGTGHYAARLGKIHPTSPSES